MGGRQPMTPAAGPLSPSRGEFGPCCLCQVCRQESPSPRTSHGPIPIPQVCHHPENNDGRNTGKPGGGEIGPQSRPCREERVDRMQGCSGVSLSLGGSSCLYLWEPVTFPCPLGAALTPILPLALYTGGSRGPRRKGLV